MGRAAARKKSRIAERRSAENKKTGASPAVIGVLHGLRAGAQESPVLSALRLNRGENIYLLCFGVYFVYCFLRTTVIPLPVVLINAMKYSAPVFGIIICSKLLIFDVDTKRDLLTVLLQLLVGLGVTAASTCIGELCDLTVYWLLLIGARNVDFRLIARTALSISLPMLISVTVLSVCGVLNDLVYVVNETSRHSFGIIYPTDYAAHWFFCGALWFLLRNGRLKWYELAVFVALTAFLFVFCEAKLDCICMLLLTAAGLLLNYKWAQKAVLRVRWGFVPCFLIFAAAAFGISIMYSSHAPLREYLEASFNTVHSRFRIAHEMLLQHPFSLFGESMAEIGNGGSLVALSEKEYTFIDISYIKIYIRCGAVVFAGLMALLTRFVFTRAAAKDAAALTVMAIVALNCMMAHHLIDFAYNVPLLMLFAQLGTNEKTAPGCTLPEQKQKKR